MSEIKPTLPGYTVTSNGSGSGWIAKSNWASAGGSPFPPITLKGKNQEELIAARRQYCREQIAEFRELLTNTAWKNADT